MDFCFIIKCFVHVLFCFVFIYLTCVIVPCPWCVCPACRLLCACAGPNIFRGVSVQLVARPRPLSTWGPRIPPAVGGLGDTVAASSVLIPIQLSKWNSGTVYLIGIGMCRTITCFSEPQPGQQAGARHDDVWEAVQPRQQDRPRRGRGGGRGRGRGSPRPGGGGAGGRQQQQGQVRWDSTCGTK